MTEPDVRDLLVELADSVEVPDLASTAWDRSVGRRRRRTAAGVGTVAAATAIAFGAVHLRADDGSTGGPAHPSPTTSLPSEPAEKTLDGFTVAVAPRLADEAALPIAGSPLSAVIDLSAPNPSVVDEPLQSAVAAFGIAKVVGDNTRFDGVMLIGPDGELRHLDATRLQPFSTPSGDGFLPFTAGSLSADGARLAFAQPDGVAVFTIPTGEWTRFSLAVTDAEARDLHWAGTDSVRLGVKTLDTTTGQVSVDRAGSPIDGTDLNVEYWWGAERTYGDRHARGAAYLDEQVPVHGVDSSPPAVVAAGDGIASVLLIPDQQPRWKNCCAVAGWLDAETVAYESTFSDNPDTTRPSQVTRVLAWNVSTGAVELVTTVTGSADMLFRGSYADLASDY
jgi:hypothetical protein